MQADKRRRLVSTAVVAVGGVLALVAGGPGVTDASAATYRDAVLDGAGLVSYWRSAERPGEARAADRARANRGRYQNGPRRGVRGLVASANRAVRYDGSNDQIRIPDDNSLDLTSSFTLEAWIKPLSAPESATIMRKDNAYFLKAERTNVRLTFWDQSGRLRNLVARDELVVGRTHHIVGTYGEGTMHMYVDGKLVATATVPRGTVARKNGEPLGIGRYGASRNGGEPFRGVIDEVAVYRAAHSPGEVAVRYAAGRGTDPPPEAADAPAKSSAPAAPTGNRAPSSWNGDFEVGGFGQYDVIQEAAEDRIALTSLARKGRYAAQLTAYDDDLQGGSNPRAQLMSDSQHFAGQEHYVGWSTYFPNDFPAMRGTGAFFVFFQFHGTPYTGSPPLGWGVGSDGRIDLRRNQQYGYDRIWTMPMPRDRWIDFVAHVKWSKSAADGFVELWVDGVKQTFSTNGQQRLYTQTVMSDQNEGLKTIPTNYRRKGIVPGPVTIYQDEVKVGSSYRAVAP
jgi:hypothetical protein